jgi:hypothetical protein
MPVVFDHAALVLSVRNVSSAFAHYQGLSVINGTAYENPCLRVWNMAASPGILCLEQNWQFCSTDAIQSPIGGTVDQALSRGWQLPQADVWNRTPAFCSARCKLHDRHGKRFYLTTEERRAFIATAATADRPVRTYV